MGEALRVLLTVALVAWVIWAMARYRRVEPELAKDRPDQPYGVYTRMFDLEVPGRDVAALLEAKGVRGPLPGKTEISSPADRLRAAELAYTDSIASPAIAGLRDSAKALASNASLALLIDQSGSMVNSLPAIAGELKAVAGILDETNVDWALLGFTTAGWRGGMAREAWARSRKPKYPGRLCALLHVTYKPFGEAVRDDDWQALLDPRALYDNIDGEALAWAASQLALRTSQNKLLVVISDGAPVDDSTLAENGATFLERHLLKTIGEISERSDMRLGAVGIGYRVDRYYATAEIADDPGMFLEALVNLLGKLAGARESGMPE